MYHTYLDKFVIYRMFICTCNLHDVVYVLIMIFIIFLHVTCMYVRFHLHTCMSVCVYMCVRIYMYVCLCVCVCVFKCVYIYMYMCACVCINKYICMYIYITRQAAMSKRAPNGAPTTG